VHPFFLAPSSEAAVVSFSCWKDAPFFISSSTKFGYSSRDVFQIDIRAADRVSCDLDLRRPDLIWIVLDPFGLGKKLSEFFLGDGDHFSGVIDYEGSGTRRSLVQG
jgi:hypothetical protein